MSGLIFEGIPTKSLHVFVLLEREEPVLFRCIYERDVFECMRLALRS